MFTHGARAYGWLGRNPRAARARPIRLGPMGRSPSLGLLAFWAGGLDHISAVRAECQTRWGEDLKPHERRLAASPDQCSGYPAMSLHIGHLRLTSWSAKSTGYSRISATGMPHIVRFALAGARCSGRSR
jgi:hypothetical protein